MKSVLVIGGSSQSILIIKTLMSIQTAEILAVVDPDPHAPGLQYAERKGIHTASRWKAFVHSNVDIVVNAWADDILKELREAMPASTVVIPYSMVTVMTNLISDKEKLIDQLKKQADQQSMILNLTHDGMVAIDQSGIVTLFNPSAEKLMGTKAKDVIGKKVDEVIPSTKLPRVIETGQPEINQQQQLDNGKKIITTRLPMLDKNGRPCGAFAVFKDISDVEELAQEITNLRSIQTMLNAIIQSSEEAISVVDENGIGIMINPAYTRLTGLTEKDVIGKPATIDISEGESMHMQVLKTRKPVRGARLKVGQSKRDVVVNVAPVIVDGDVKGSVGIIQDMSEITALTNELNRARQIIRTLEAKYSFEDIIGESEEFRLVKEQARLAASTPISILLRGESGTGKELFAHAIHNASGRKYNKFVRVNCAAISESLLESEMFGYEEGAFSGAKKGGKRGYFEEAAGGSIFLDEIGELSTHMQAKLLRVLQEKEIVRVGGTKPIPVDVRVITATNVNLEKRIADGSFREDLYYRLNRMPIFIPPLRQRKEDIGHLVRHLLGKINRDYGRNVEDITPEALGILTHYNWPGNVRELENVLGRAVIYMGIQENVIQAMHIPPLLSGHGMPTSMDLPVEDGVRQSLTELMDAYEKDIIRKTLVHHNFNKTKTARALGISVRNLYYKMEKYRLESIGMQKLAHMKGFSNAPSIK
ncbi:MAG: sigma 54-interacting transcriptional regulator [Tuberibacillus sp.]